MTSRRRRSSRRGPPSVPNMGVSCSDRFTNPHREAASTDGQDSGSCSKLSTFYMIFIIFILHDLHHLHRGSWPRAISCFLEAWESSRLSRELILVMKTSI